MKREVRMHSTSVPENEGGLGEDGKMKSSKAVPYPSEYIYSFFSPKQ